MNPTVSLKHGRLRMDDVRLIGEHANLSCTAMIDPDRLRTSIWSNTEGVLSFVCCKVTRPDVAFRSKLYYGGNPDTEPDCYCFCDASGIDKDDTMSQKGFVFVSMEEQLTGRA
ncbi:hypothetical protein Tco_1504258 [Tanacetum coccineum]